MRKLARWLLGSENEQPPPPAGWAPSAIADIVEQFPPGAKILYHPELKRELRLESVLLGYSFGENRFAYSPRDLVVQRSDGRISLSLSAPEGEAPLTEVRTFQILVPFQTRAEIDFRGAEGDQEGAQFTQSAVNDFERRNSVTLIAFRPFGRVPHLETSVRGVSVLKHGFYANQKVVVLDPLPQSLTHVDKRRHQRVHTCIPLVFRTSPQSAPQPCTLEDFSERFLRIRPPEGAPSEDLTPGRRLALRLDLEAQGRTFVLQAAVFRHTKGAVVVELQGIFKEGRFVELHVVDQLDLKAALLQHPETQRLLRRPAPGAPPPSAPS